MYVRLLLIPAKVKPARARNAKTGFCSVTPTALGAI